METLAVFASYATATVLEAAPFLLLGSLVGSIFEVFMPDDLLRRILPRGGVAQVLCGLLAGMLLPTCECGVVPVARKLLVKGVPPRAAIPYMMAAPVINPVVLASTFVAFQGDWSMVLWRAMLVAVPAAGLGLALGKAGPEHVLRAPGLKRMDKIGHGDSCVCCGHGKTRSRLGRLVLHTGHEFLDMLRFLVLGALVASAFKTFAPLDMVRFFSSNLVLSVAGMMLLAVVLSICSEADAFVAAGFTLFPEAARLSFVAIGPMVDIKLIFMFLAVFPRPLVRALVVVPTVTVFLMALVLGWWGVL